MITHWYISQETRIKNPILNSAPLSAGGKPVGLKALNQRNTTPLNQSVQIQTKHLQTDRKLWANAD